MATNFLLISCWTVWVVMATLCSVDAKLVDLSHDHSIITHMSTPDEPKYKTDTLLDGEFLPGVYMKYNSYSLGEHGGTHIDSPNHMSRTGYSLDQIPLENTIAEGVMIDCAEEAGREPEYKLPLQKVKDWEKKHGKIPLKSAVLINFNWSRKFTDSNAYFGSQDLTNSSSFKFPYISAEAAKFLLDERDILILGTDTMSSDPMYSRFHVHIALLGKNRILVENLKDVGKLPPRAFRFHASPYKFVGGTGVQVRAYAFVHEDVSYGSASVLSVCSVSIVFVMIIVSMFTHLLSEF